MNKKEPTINDALQKIDLSLDTSDQLKRDAFAKLSALQNLKQRALVVERKRLSAKYGAEHTRVRAVEAKIKFNARFIKGVNIEKDKADIPSPAVTKDIWLLHGRVMDENYVGTKAMTISLFDKNQKWVKELGTACTDVRGYFAISYPAKEGSRSDIPESQELYLTVTNAENRVLHRETEPLFIKIGRAEYRDVVISEPGEHCHPPEPIKPEPGPKTENGGNS